MFRTINGFVVVKLNITCETDNLELEIRFRFVSRGVTRRGCLEWRVHAYQMIFTVNCHCSGASEVTAVTFPCNPTLLIEAGL